MVGDGSGEVEDDHRQQQDELAVVVKQEQDDGNSSNNNTCIATTTYNNKLARDEDDERDLFLCDQISEFMRRRRRESHKCLQQDRRNWLNLKRNLDRYYHYNLLVKNTRHSRQNGGGTASPTKERDVNETNHYPLVQVDGEANDNSDNNDISYMIGTATAATTAAATTIANTTTTKKHARDEEEEKDPPKRRHEEAPNAGEGPRRTQRPGYPK